MCVQPNHCNLGQKLQPNFVWSNKFLLQEFVPPCQIVSTIYLSDLLLHIQRTYVRIRLSHQIEVYLLSQKVDHQDIKRGHKVKKADHREIKK